MCLCAWPLREPKGTLSHFSRATFCVCGGKTVCKVLQWDILLRSPGFHGYKYTTLSHCALQSGTPSPRFHLFCRAVGNESVPLTTQLQRPLFRLPFPYHMSVSAQFLYELVLFVFPALRSFRKEAFSPFFSPLNLLASSFSFASSKGDDSLMYHHSTRDRVDIQEDFRGDLKALGLSSAFFSIFSVARMFRCAFSVLLPRTGAGYMRVLH